MAAAEFSLRKATALSPLLYPDLIQEQSIELDCVLPDYCPDFFRLLHCTAAAQIISRSLNDSGMSYTLKVRLRVLYCTENSPAVCEISQSLEYQKQVSVPQEIAALSPQLLLSAAPAYLNCRAVNHRRLDLRGAVNVRVSFAGTRQTEMLSGAEGSHIYCKTAPLTCISDILHTEKKFTLSEDIRLSDTQPALLSVLREQIDLSVSETRILAGKLIVKGEAAVTLLYSSEQGVETVTAAFPFSQIAEQSGLTDGMPCSVTAELTDLLLTQEAENNGDVRLLHCDLQILLHCTAVRTSETVMLTDLYATDSPLQLQHSQAPLLTAPVSVSETLRLRQVLRSGDAVFTKVYAAWAEPSGTETAEHTENGGIVLSGSLLCCVLGADAENKPVMLEEKLPFTWELPNLLPGQPLPPLRVQSCPYTLSGSDSVTVQPELLLSGNIMQQTDRSVLTDAVPDPEQQPAGSEPFAVRLYFGQPEESLWEIAKRCRTSAEVIREENDVSGETLAQPQMLLIPIIQ